MIKQIKIRNFRNIEKADLELGKITILTGANNSGKSGILYSLLTLKNLILNMNQSLDAFLNLTFINLGGFDETVFMKDKKKKIELGISTEEDGLSSSFSAEFGKDISSLYLKCKEPIPIDLKLDVLFPYPANKSIGKEITTDSGTVKIAWNGLVPNITMSNHETSQVNENNIDVNEISYSLNLPFNDLRALDFVGLRRGFTKPIYSPVPMHAQLISEDEFATVLAANRDLEGKVALYLEKIVDRFFSVRPTIGTATFNLQTRDKKTGLVCDLVNEGFGTNQLATLLTNILLPDKYFICIEEPEIHLHPLAIIGLAEVLIEITRNEEKCLLIASHSEHLVMSMLNAIAEGKLSKDDFYLYYLKKERKAAVVERQIIKDNGQIEGGLKGFYEAQLEILRNFFELPKDM